MESTAVHVTIGNSNYIIMVFRPSTSTMQTLNLIHMCKVDVAE